MLALRASFAIWTLKLPPLVVPNFVTPPVAPVRIVNTLEDSLINPFEPPPPLASLSSYILLLMILVSIEKALQNDEFSVHTFCILVLFNCVFRTGAVIRFVASMKVDVICKTADKFLVLMLEAFT